MFCQLPASVAASIDIATDSNSIVRLRRRRWPASNNTLFKRSIMASTCCIDSEQVAVKLTRAGLSISLPAAGQPDRPPGVRLPFLPA